MYLFFGSGDAGCFCLYYYYYNFYYTSSNFTIAIYSRKTPACIPFSFNFSSLSAIPSLLTYAYIHKLLVEECSYIQNQPSMQLKHHHRLTFLYEYMCVCLISLYSFHYNNKKYTNNIKLLLFHKYFHRQIER